MLKDAGRADGEVGQTTIVAATVADFSAIVLLSLLFSASDGGPGSRLVLIGVFALLVAATGVVVGRVGMSRRLGDVLLRLQDTTAEIRVRFAVVLLIAFTALAERFGLESILGAFLAGVVVSVVDRDSTSHPFFRAKLEAIGFGFVIPVFFVSSGIRLDLQGLLDNPSALLRVPVFLVALLVMRGIPALLYVRTLGRRPRACCRPAAGHVAAVHRRRDARSAWNWANSPPVTAAAIVSAGLLSVLIFPAVALSLLREPSDGGGEALPSPTGSARHQGHHVEARPGIGGFRASR